jgi:hypothetical protein
MEIKMIKVKDIEIAVVSSGELIITDVQSALDFIATVNYETGVYRIVINKSAIIEEFFDLKTKLAGDVLQKFVNYNTKIAIVGDFSVYSSKSLKDFIYESNKGKNIFFVASEEDGIEKLSTV